MRSYTRILKAATTSFRQIPIVWCTISGTMTVLDGSARTASILILAIAIDLIYRKAPTRRWLVNSNAKSIY